MTKFSKNSIELKDLRITVMKKTLASYTLTLFALIFFTFCNTQKISETRRLTDYVNPFIGTGGKGNTYPGATVPFGMVQLSPDNGRSGWDWISGYYYPDTVLAGFSHLHLSGTGAGDLYDISYFPYTGKPILAKPGVLGPKSTPYSHFNHAQESASPGYYQVQLLDYPILVELSSTKRTGLQRYSFQKEAEATIILNLGYARNWDWVSDSYLEIINDTILSGYRKSSGWAKDQRVYFYSVLSKPMAFAEIFNGDEIVDPKAQGTDLQAKLHFSVSESETILIKTGISTVSIKNAKLNLNSEQTGFDFEKVKEEARMVWENQLQKIRIKTDDDNMIQFYTAMYHSMLGPTLFSDNTGEYKGADGEIHQVTDHERYTSFSLWDTYRALHPLATILHPARTVDFIKSMLDHYDETGLLPVWDLLGNETNMMIGYHAVPVMADAILKGLDGLDVQKAYEAMKASAMHDQQGLKSYKKRGYVSQEVRNWNVSLTLEYAFDDWCIAQISKKLGQEEEYNYFIKRSQNYRNHYDSKTGFMRSKDSTGQFRASFDPNAYSPDDYCEANAWHYNWYVPQDVEGLIELTGGSEAFEVLLDSMFRTSPTVDDSHDWISGNIGQYVHGNEPSHHVPYLYQFSGSPEKTQKWVRQIMDDLYTTDPNGLCGNEDFGQLSAWYIFSAMGFYPVNPADGKYILGSPEISEASIQLPNNKQFNILVKNQHPEHKEVKTVYLNGIVLNRPFITHAELMAGGELIFEMRRP